VRYDAVSSRRPRRCGAWVITSLALFEVSGDPILRFFHGFPAQNFPFVALAPPTLQGRSIGEFEDSALLNVFGRALGVFPAPSAIEKATRQQYGVEPIGRVDAVQARFYAISVERRLKHPAVVAIVEAARRRVFG
jgi:hypothetical protein